MKKKLVVLTGAGMSAESGISTFRDAGGLWDQYRVEDVATPKVSMQTRNLYSISITSNVTNCCRQSLMMGISVWLNWRRISMCRSSHKILTICTNAPEVRM